MNTASALPSNPSAGTEDKTTAIVSYLTLIGFIVAVVMHGSKKTSLGAYHLRQSLGLMIAWVAMIVVGMILAFIPVIGWLADVVLWIGLVVLWFMGLLNAIKGEMKPVPLIGQQFEKWFANTFN